MSECEYEIRCMQLGQLMTNCFVVWPDGQSECWIVDPAQGVDRLLRLLQTVVFHRLLDDRKRVGDVLAFESFPQHPQRVYHPRVSGEVAEKDEAFARIVADQLIVQQSAACVYYVAEHGHVVSLRLDRVREKTKDVPGGNVLERYFFDAESTLQSETSSETTAPAASYSSSEKIRSFEG